MLILVPTPAPESRIAAALERVRFGTQSNLPSVPATTRLLDNRRVDVFAAVTGAVALALSLVLAVREMVQSRRRNAKQQAEAVSVTAEFIDFDGNTPVCRVICHNKSTHAITDVYAYVAWEAMTQWPDGSIAPSKCLDIIGFFGVGPEAIAERTDKLKGNPVEPPPVIPGTFPVKFTLTDASHVRWERGLDGKLRKNPSEMLGNRLDDESQKSSKFWRRRKMSRMFG